MLIFNSIFDLLLTDRGFSVSSLAFLRFREQKYIENHRFGLSELFLRYSVPVSANMLFVFMIETNLPMLVWKIKSIYREHRNEDVNTQRGRRAEFYNLIQEGNIVTFVP